MLDMHEIQGRLPRPVDGLLFGLEGVLFDDALWRRWLLRLLNSHLSVRTDYDALCRCWNARCMSAVCRGQRSLSEAFRMLLSSYGLSGAQANELELACHAQWRRHQSEARPLPGVKKTLLQLRDAGVVMGVLSDSECSGGEIRRRLEDGGLEDAFVSVVSSLDLGQTKPSPIGYVHSARAMGLDPDDVAFVGRRPEELTGASATGMQTIALDHGGCAQADLSLGRFEQLLELFDAPRRYAAAG